MNPIRSYATWPERGCTIGLPICVVVSYPDAIAGNGVCDVRRVLTCQRVGGLGEAIGPVQHLGARCPAPATCFRDPIEVLVARACRSDVRIGGTNEKIVLTVPIDISDEVLVCTVADLDTPPILGIEVDQSGTVPEQVDFVRRWVERSWGVIQVRCEARDVVARMRELPNQVVSAVPIDVRDEPLVASSAKHHRVGLFGVPTRPRRRMEEPGHAIVCGVAKH